MEGLRLLKKARAAGLTVAVDGDQLVIRGPQRAAAIAQQLIASKPAVMEALRPAANIPAVDTCRLPTESNPAKVTVGDKTYDVAMTAEMWFFRLSFEAGWTAASPEFREFIEQQLTERLSPGPVTADALPGS
jgi:hypothetical protein